MAKYEVRVCEPGRGHGVEEFLTRKTDRTYTHAVVYRFKYPGQPVGNWAACYCGSQALAVKKLKDFRRMGIHCQALLTHLDPENLVLVTWADDRGDTGVPAAVPQA